MARVTVATAQRVLEKNALIVMVFPVMVSHAHNVRDAPLQVDRNVPPMVIVHHAQTAPTALVMLTVVSEVNVPVMVIALPLVTVHSEAIDHVMVTVLNDHLVTVPATVTEMANRVKNVRTVPLVIAPLTGTAEIAMRGPNGAAMAVVDLTALLEESVQGETVEVVHHMVTVHNALVIVLFMETVVHVPIVVTVHPMSTVRAVIVPVMVIGGLDLSVLIDLTVHPTATVHVEIVPPMATEVLAPTAEIVLHMVIAQSVPASVSVVVVPTAPVHLARVVARAVVLIVILVLKNLNLLKNSAWHANFEWFAPITMTLGLMTMLLTTCSIRVPAMS